MIFEATLVRTVTQTLKVRVTAKTQAEAEEKAEELLDAVDFNSTSDTHDDTYVESVTQR